MNSNDNNGFHRTNDDATPNHYSIGDHAQPLRRANNVQILFKNYSRLKHSTLVYPTGGFQVNFLPPKPEKLRRSPQGWLPLHTVLHTLPGPWHMRNEGTVYSWKLHLNLFWYWLVIRCSTRHILAKSEKKSGNEQLLSTNTPTTAIQLPKLVAFTSNSNKLKYYNGGEELLTISFLLQRKSYKYEI